MSIIRSVEYTVAMVITAIIILCLKKSLTGCLMCVLICHSGYSSKCPVTTNRGTIVNLLIFLNKVYKGHVVENKLCDRQVC